MQKNERKKESMSPTLVQTVDFFFPLNHEYVVANSISGVLLAPL